MMLGEGGQDGVSIQDFSGGETDFPLAGRPNQHAVLRNFLIREDNKALHRNGSEIADLSTKTSDTSSFMTTVKSAGQTSGLSFSSGKNLLVHTKENVFYPSNKEPWDVASTWAKILVGSATNTFTALLSGADATPTTFTNDCMSPSDNFGAFTYIFPREVNAIGEITKFSPGLTVTDDNNSLTGKCFGLPTPSRGLYAQTFATVVTFYNEVALKFKNHVLNVYSATDHAAIQDSGDYSATPIVTNLATTSTYDDLEKEVRVLWGCFFAHIKDARVTTNMATYHQQAGNYATGMLSFYPKPIGEIRALVTLYDAIFDMANVLNLHIKDFLNYIAWTTPTPGYPALGDFRHTDVDSARVVTSGYPWYSAYTSYLFQDLLTSTNPLLPMYESLRLMKVGGDFSTVPAGASYQTALSFIAAGTYTEFSDLLFFIVSLGYALWDVRAHTDNNPLYGCGDIASILGITLNAPSEKVVSNIQTMASQEEMVITQFWSVLHYHTFTISPMSLRLHLEDSSVLSNGTEFTEVSGVVDITLPCFVETYVRRSNIPSPIQASLCTKGFTYNSIPRPPITQNIRDSATLKIFRLSSDGSDNNYHFVSQIGATSSYATPIPGDYNTVDTLKLQHTDYYTDTGVNAGCIFSCLNFFIVNNCGWAVGPVLYETNVETLESKFTFYPYRVMQSMQNAPTNFPDTFYYDFKERVVGGGHVIEKPVVTTQNAIYRIDSLFALDGSGGFIPQAIQTINGSNSPMGFITVNNMVYFAGSDCLYRTDGYSSSFVSMNKVHSFLPVDKKKIKATYSQAEKSIYWVMANSSGEYNELWVMNLEKPVTDVSCLTRVDGGLDTATSNMLASCIVFTDAGEMIRGDKDGFIFIHRDTLYADPRVDRATHSLARSSSDNSILTDHIPFDWRSVHHNFGSNHERKYVTQFDFSAENSSSEVTETLTLQPYYVNDRGRIHSTLPEMAKTVGAVDLNPIRVFTPTDGIFYGKRLFAPGSLRCLYKQMGFMPAFVKICDNTSVHALGTVIGNAFVLDGSAYFPYSDLINCFLQLGDDAYSTSYRIINSNIVPGIGYPNTLVIDPSQTLPSGDSKPFKIVGYPKTERFALVEVNIPTTKFSTVEQNQKDSAT